MYVNFYKGKKVLITGHTGFKGTWLSKILVNAGAEVVGYAKEPTIEPSLYSISNVNEKMTSIIGDVRDLDMLKKVFNQEKPEIVFHLAAQPLVIDSYKDPVYTYQTNVMGTVNVCECVRLSDSVKSFVNVTTDKVYKNNEWEWGYRENEPLDGFDPYSNSKSCSELVTHSYINSFFQNMDVRVATARAGNVIGGGDFSDNRIIPDCVRSVLNNETIMVRNPNSIRPYQHVLEPLSAYLLIAAKQYEDAKYAGYYNVGPDEKDCITTGELVEIFCRKWGSGAKWQEQRNTGPHEANFLKLDCSKIKRNLGWKPKWEVEEAILQTVIWYKAYMGKENIEKIMDEQIKNFFAD